MNLKKVSIRLDDKEVPANEFVQRVFSSILIAVVENLKKVDQNWEKLEVVVER